MDLLASFASVLAEQVSEQIPLRPAFVPVRSAGQDRISVPVEVIQEVSLGVEDDEDVVWPGPVPERVEQLVHRVGLAGADPAQEKNVSAEVFGVEPQPPGLSLHGQHGLALVSRADILRRRLHGGPLEQGHLGPRLAFRRTAGPGHEGHGGRSRLRPARSVAGRG